MRRQQAAARNIQHDDARVKCCCVWRLAHRAVDSGLPGGHRGLAGGAEGAGRSEKAIVCRNPCTREV